MTSAMLATTAATAYGRTRRAEPARAARRGRPHVPLRFHDVVVRAVRPLTPHMLRITFAGPSLADFADDGPDQRCKLFLPRADGSAPVVPRERDWFTLLRALPEPDRPIARTYTVRAARPHLAEVDIDFALHLTEAGPAAEGPATTWARRAHPGERAVLWGAWAEYHPPAGTAWRLLVGDDTALPAVAAILERLPAGTPAHVVLEVADASAHQPLPTRADARVRWVHRAEALPTGYQGADVVGGPLLAALRAAVLPAGAPYAWVAGEAGAVTAVRRHLVRERGLPADAVTFLGYWRRGGPIERTA